MYHNKNKGFFVVVILWVLLSAIPGFAFAQGKSCSESDLLCGPKCLLTVCRKLGAEAELGELTALCGHNHKLGTTMLGLRKALSAKGLQAVGMKIGIEELMSFKGPAIAHRG